MAAITDYASLNDALRAWTTSSELEQFFDAFIQGAEADMNKVLRHPQMMTDVALSISASRLNPLPTDWLETVAVINTNDSPAIAMEYVTNADAEELQDQNPSAKMFAFTTVGTKIQVVPMVSAPVFIRLAYYQKIPGLTASNTTNWLLQLDPLLYLYATLRHAAPYLNDDARAAIWQNEYNNRCNDLNLAGDIARFSGQRLVAKSRTSF